MVGNRIAGATGGFVSAGLTWSNNDHFCHIANNWLHVANLNGALRISSLRSGAGENVVVNNSIETSISDNTEGINVTGTVTAGTILKIENNALHDLGHVYLFWRTVAPDGIRFGVCGFAVQWSTVPQRAAAPSSAGCVAARSQVATYSLPASDLQRNWLAARYTTINKHALGGTNETAIMFGTVDSGSIVQLNFNAYEGWTTFTNGPQTSVSQTGNVAAPGTFDPDDITGACADASCVDGGHPGGSYIDHDLSRNDIGVTGGSFHYDNFFPILTGGARVYLVRTPRTVLQSSTIDAEGDAFDR